MAVFVRPDGDISTGNWASTPDLWQKIDETPFSDSDFVQSENDPSNDIMEVTLENQSDPASSTGHIVRYRLARNQSGGGQPGTLNVIVGLYQGTTLIATQTESDVPLAFAEYSFTLTGGEADNITDYDDLRIRWDADKSAGARTTWCELSFAEFETPSAAATFDQVDFRVRPSDADPLINANAGGDWDQLVDVNASMEPDLLFRIRFGVNSAVSGETEGFQIRSQKNGAGGYTLIPNTATPFTFGAGDNVEIQCIAGSYTDGAATTDLLNPTGSFVAGNGNDDNTTAAIVFATGEHTELEFCILFRKLSDTGHLADGDFFDFRIYRDDGTALDTYTVTPRVTVLNRPGHIGGTWIETSLRNLVVDDDGNLYSVHELADTPDTAIRLAMMKSADGGDSWTLMDDGNAPAETDIEAVDMDYHAASDTIFIGMQGESGDNVHFYTFRVAGHASADTWDIDELVTTTSTPADQAVAIAHRGSPENDTILFYQKSQVSSRDQIGYKRKPDGGSWGSENVLDSEASTDVTHPVVVREPGDDTLHIFYHTSNGTVGELWHQTMTPSSDTVDGTRTQVDQAITVHAGPPGNKSGAFSNAVIWDDAGTERVGVLYQDDAGDDPYWNQSTTSTPSWGNEQQISTTDMKHNLLNTRQPNADIVVDDVDDEPWAIWVDDEASPDRFRLLSDTRVSGSWGTDTVEDTSRFTMIRAITFTHSSGNGGDRVIGLLVNDMREASSPSTGGVPSNDGGTGFTRYFEIVLAVGGATIVTPAVVALGFGMPAPAVLAEATVTPAVDGLAFDLPLPVAQAAATVTPAVDGLAFDLPAPAALAAATVTPAVDALPFDVPAPTILAAATVTPAVSDLVFDLPLPTAVVAINVNPAVNDLVYAMPTPAALAAALVTPAVAALILDLPVPLVLGAATVTPAAIGLIFDLPGPQVTVAPTVTPAVAALAYGMPLATILAGAVVTPAVAGLVFDVPQPTVLIGAAVVNPAVNSLAFDLPTPAILAASVVTPAVNGLAYAMPLPTVLAASVVTPGAAALIYGMPLPTVLAAAVVTPAVADLVLDLPQPTILVAGDATVTPGVNPLVFDVPAPTILAASVVTPAANDLVYAMPLPAVAVAPTVTPAVVGLTFDIPSPLVLGAATVNPAVIGLLLDVPGPQVAVAPTVTPAVAGLVFDLPAPSILFGNTVTPAVVVLVFDVPTPGAVGFIVLGDRVDVGIPRAKSRTDVGRIRHSKRTG